MLTVANARTDLCAYPEGVVSSDVSWDASATGTTGTQVFLKEPGKERVLWSAAGAKFNSKTGPWLREGSEVILVDARDSKDLAKVVITTVACAR